MIDKLVVKLLTLKMWLSDDHGQDVMEYAVITGSVAILIVGAAVIFGTAGSNWFGRMAAWFDGNVFP